MTFRKIIFWFHLCIGVGVGVVVLNMAVTGIMLAFRPQIEAFAEKELRQVTPPAPEAKRLGLNVLLAKIQETFPDATPGSITQRSDPTASVSINLGREQGTLYLNPYTGAILGKGSKIRDFLQSVQDWHRWFGSKEIGKPITGVACAGMFLLVLSGFYLWWPREQNSFAAVMVFSSRLRGKARDWNWHNVIGFWSAPFLLITTTTGLVMSYSWANNLLYRMTGNEPPPQEQKAAPSNKEGRSSGSSKGKSEAQTGWASMDFDGLWAQSEKRIPQWETITLRLPQKPGAPVTASILEAAAWGPNPRSQLTLQASTAEMVKWEPYSEQNTGKKARGWVVPLHTGLAWGITGQIVATAVAMGATMLVWTGFALAWRRFLARKINANTIL